MFVMYMVQQTYLDNVNMLKLLIAPLSVLKLLVHAEVSFSCYCFEAACKLLLFLLFASPSSPPFFEWAGVPVKI